MSASGLQISLLNFLRRGFSLLNPRGVRVMAGPAALAYAGDTHAQCGGQHFRTILVLLRCSAGEPGFSQENPRVSQAGPLDPHLQPQLRHPPPTHAQSHTHTHTSTDTHTHAHTDTQQHTHTQTKTHTRTHTHTHTTQWTLLLLISSSCDEPQCDGRHRTNRTASNRILLCKSLLKFSLLGFPPILRILHAPTCRALFNSDIKAPAAVRRRQ